MWIIATLPALKIDIDNYPAIKRHLLSFDKERLEQIGRTLPDGRKSRKKTDHAWYELQDTCAYHAEFEKDKIVYSEIVRRPQFFYDTDKFYVEATSFLMIGRNAKYLCALLNSKPVAFFFKKYYAGGGLGEDGYRYKKAFLNNLPVPAITESNRKFAKDIEGLVDKILFAKECDKNVETAIMESKIDKLVYQLYDLDQKEIRLIESGK